MYKNCNFIVNRVWKNVFHIVKQKSLNFHSQKSHPFQVQKLCLPFLRLAALLRHHLYNQPLPDVRAPQSEFVRLVYYLELVTEGMDWGCFNAAVALNWPPSTDPALEDGVSYTTPQTWCAQFAAFVSRSQIAARSFLVDQHITWHPPRLLDLPREYEKIFTVSFFLSCFLFSFVVFFLVFSFVFSLFLFFLQFILTISLHFLLLQFVFNLKIMRFFVKWIYKVCFSSFSKFSCRFHNFFFHFPYSKTLFSIPFKPLNYFPHFIRIFAPIFVRLNKNTFFFLFRLCLQYYHERQCSQCQSVPVETSICLLCGTIVCLKQSCCKQQNVCEAVAHSIDCGGGTGVYLVVTSTYIIVIRGRRACLWGSLYLDDFEEEDRDLK